MKNYTEKELKEIIERDYGFKKELITKPHLCGLWHIRFEVNGISYYGSTPYYGARPMLSVEGYNSPYFYKGTPITEEYYNKHIKNHWFNICQYTDPESGDWKNTRIRFKSEDEAIQYIENSHSPNKYFYEIGEPIKNS